MTRKVTRILLTRTAGVLFAAVIFFGVGIIAAEAGGNLTVTGNLRANGADHEFRGPILMETNSDSPLTFNNTDNSWQYLQFNQSGVRRAWLGLDNYSNLGITKENGGDIYLNGANIGIGTSSPSSKLDVVGDIDINDHELYFRRSSGNAYGIGYGAYGGSQLTLFSDDLIQFSESDGGTVRAAWSMNSATFDFYGDVDVYGGADVLTGDLNVNAGSAWIYGTLNAGGNVYAQGYLGVGTTSPSERLDVRGDVRVQGNVKNFTILQSNASNGRIRLGGCASGNGNCIADSSSPDINYATGDEDLYIEDDLEVDGAIYCAGGCTGSSRVLKTNIASLDLHEARAIVRDLRPTTFAYKLDPNEKRAGFIAEEVPDLVAFEGRKGLDAMDIVAVVTKVVQGQEEQLRQLRADNADLRRELQALREQVEAMKGGRHQ